MNTEFWISLIALCMVGLSTTMPAWYRVVLVCVNFGVIFASLYHRGLL